MLLRKIVLCIVCYIAMSLSQSHAQQNLFLNFNVYNGLPSNHVYQVVIDAYGYAWIATTKGVLKYNGYKFRKFGEKDGLPREDVWMLVEDEYHRIWLNSKAYELGYIKNDKYKTVIRGTGGMGIYPKQMTRIKGGIGFLNTRNIFGQVYDTIDFYRVIGDKVIDEQILNEWTMLKDRGIDAEGNFNVLLEGDLFKLLKKSSRKREFQKKCSFPKWDIDRKQYFFSNSGNYFLFLGSAKNQFVAYSLTDCKTFTYSLDSLSGEHILGAHQVGNTYHLSTNKRRVVFDGNFRLLNTYWLKDVMPEADTAVNSLVWYVNDKLWKGFSTTSNIGIYQSLGANAFYFLHKVNFKEAQYIGTSKNCIQYWWQNPTRELIMVKPNGEVVVKELKQLYAINGICDFGTHKVLICSTIGYFIFNEKTTMLEPYVKEVTARYAYGINMANVMKSNKSSSSNADFKGHIKLFGIVGDTIYSWAGFRLNWIKYKNGIIYEKLLCPISQVSDLDMEAMCSYSYYEGKLELYNIRNDKAAKLDSVALKLLGIGKLKGIVVDKFGKNILLLSNTGLHIYNWHSRVFRKATSAINPSACDIEMHKDRVVLLSEFGLAVYKTDSLGNISSPVYIPNGKYARYRYLVGGGFYVDDTTVCFNTDKGLCKVYMPEVDLYSRKQHYTDYKLLMIGNDTVRQIHTGDTIRLAGPESNLFFDVINPIGVGEVAYRYNVVEGNDSWKDLNANEWNPNGLLPGKSHKVYLQAFDDGWYSDVFVVYLYIEPRWWQTLVGKAILGGAVLVSLGLLVVVAVFFTKRVADRANARKNLQTELKSLRTEIELKSIHAQINPHFIFNSLSTGLYFIKKNKMEDAYDHISAFSQLLRNYIGASRDKYILLNEEIDNLRRYVTLQQSRFENLHEFDVEIGEGVNIYGEKIPALLLQPLVENAINHGLFHKTVQGRLLLKFEKAKDGTLICIVDDNGVGRERSKEIKAEVMHKTQSYGTDLIKELIETFNKYEPLEISIEYIDKQLPETGTIVILTIKMLNQKEGKV